MGLAQSGQPYVWNYTAADQVESLYIESKVYNVTSGVPVLVTSIALTHTLKGSYFGSYTFLADKIYQIISLVYTDAGFTTLDTDRAPTTETIQVVDFNSGGGGASVNGSNTVLLAEQTQNAVVLSDQSTNTVLTIEGDTDEVL